eukprot:CAMPEP_0171995232 /NCGR_PEP_ID=MMETSP0993-20121228/279366_1 /TAXON_ID=483369 /ORGANISM="non described non described, Strain CCMP2098" /LENGTH=298 /DNA_ID=CAMNT_0012648333 /DNA_START=11 /DNA_END=907 /DNA_ORIENTATION=+
MMKRVLVELATIKNNGGSRVVTNGDENYDDDDGGVDDNSHGNGDDGSSGTVGRASGKLEKTCTMNNLDSGGDCTEPTTTPIVLGILGLEENVITSEASRFLLAAAKEAGGVRVLLAGNPCAAEAAVETQPAAEKEEGDNQDKVNGMGSEGPATSVHKTWDKERAQAATRVAAVLTKNHKDVEEVASGAWSERRIWIGAARVKEAAERYNDAAEAFETNREKNASWWWMAVQRIVFVAQLVAKELHTTAIAETLLAITAASVLTTWMAVVWVGSDGGGMANERKRYNSSKRRGTGGKGE